MATSTTSTPSTLSVTKNLYYTKTTKHSAYFMSCTLYGYRYIDVCDTIITCTCVALR